MYTIHLLPATFGDSILIEYGEQHAEHYILIDGGPYYNFKNVLHAIREVAPALTTLDLLVITHIDIDHIDGIIILLNQSDPPFAIKEVWFNGFKELEQLKKLVKDDMLGPLQGEYLSTLIKTKEVPHNVAFENGVVCVTDYQSLPVVELAGGMKLTIVSPGAADLLKLYKAWDDEIELITEEESIAERWSEETRYPADLLGGTDKDKEKEAVADTSVANRSSIAFLATYDNKTCLLAGDAPADRLLNAIVPLLEQSGQERLVINAWKLAHHGSKKSTSAELIKKIDCRNILISTDGKRYKHPDRECIQQLLKESPERRLFFNYRSAVNSIWENESSPSGFSTIYPGDNTRGISITIE